MVYRAAKRSNVFGLLQRRGASLFAVLGLLLAGPGLATEIPATALPTGGGQVQFKESAVVNDFSSPIISCLTMTATISPGKGGVISLYNVDVDDDTVSEIEGTPVVGVLSNSNTTFTFKPLRAHIRMVVDSIATNHTSSDVVVTCSEYREAAFLNGDVTVLEATTGTDTNPEGKWVFCTATCIRTLPEITRSGENICYYSITDAKITLSPQADDQIRLNGALGTADKDILSDSNQGEFICVVSRENGNDDEWITLGRNGAWTVEP